MQDRATIVNRLHKVLEWANLKLTSVASNVTGGISAGHLGGIIVRGAG